MKKYLNLLVILGYMVLSVVMYRHYWLQLINDDSKNNAVFGEVSAVEWSMEQVYQNMIAKNNPFSSTDEILYPFGSSFTNTDSGSAIFFPLLRSYLSSHQSSSILIVIYILMANFGMYLLLITLGGDVGVAFLIGLAFGYMTFLQSRAGHITYMSIYVFPWLYLLIHLLVKSTNIMKKIVSSIGIASILYMSLLHNLYYFVMQGIGLISMASYILFNCKKDCCRWVKINHIYLLIVLCAFLLLLFPWLQQVNNNRIFEGLPMTEGWGGALDYSSDLFGYFFPGPYSSFLATPTSKIATVLPFIRDRFENFTYPGIIILISYSSLVWYFWKKKSVYEKEMLNTLKPYFYTGIVFLILTLGPFLHIMGKWGINLDGIKVVIPLPFIIFHYLPFMANIRAPGRLIVGFIFFAYVTSAIFISWILKGRNQKFKAIVYVLLITLFVLDHTFDYPKAQPNYIPNSIYEIIKNDKEYFTVYEMPSVVRDGFRYFGSVDSLNFLAGELYYGKPILAGYFGRIPDFKREYYQNNPFLGYMGRLMDSGVQFNGSLDRTELPKWNNIEVTSSERAIDYLSLKYVVLDMNQPYAASAASALAKLKFSRIAYDQKFTLWQRLLNQTEFLSVQLGQPGDEISIGKGWRGRDNKFRWAEKTSSILFKIGYPREFNLLISGASYYKPQVAKVYVNQKWVASITFITEVMQYSVAIPSEYFKAGINTIHVVFPKAFKPLLVESGNNDESMLAAKFIEFRLEDL